MRRRRHRPHARSWGGRKTAAFLLLLLLQLRCCCTHTHLPPCVRVRLQLGDIIDYHNTELPDCGATGQSASELALRGVLRQFERLAPRPTLHLLGG